jgi:Protein of unknown function (DUF2721)
MQASELSGAVGILSVMITPALLISACGSLIIATSNRLGRVIDRTRQASDRFAELARDQERTMLGEERQLLFDQLSGLTRRARMLQRAMARLYLAVSAFVGTSVSLGLVAVTDVAYAWAPIGLGLLGVGLLFAASLSLIAESRIGLQSVEDEMDFVWRLGQHNAPEGMRLPRRRNFFGRERQ